MTGKPGKHFASDIFGAILQYLFPPLITCIRNLTNAAVRIIYVYIPDCPEHIIGQFKCLTPATSFDQNIHLVSQITFHRISEIPGIPVIYKSIPVAVFPYKPVYSLL